MYPMSSTSTLAELIRPLFVPTQRGVVGLVDELLKICQDHRLDLDWNEGQCRVRSIGAVPEETFEAALPKSVFRALLARLAALCNQRSPGSVSPYGGEGQLTIGADPAVVFSVSFTNTPDEQRVRLMPVEKKESQSPTRSGFLVRLSAP